LLVGPAPVADARYLHASFVTMFTLRIMRHDRQEQVLAECQSACVPTSGEVLQLDTVDENGEKVRPSTLWRVVSVTLHVPSLNSAPPKDGSPLLVRMVEVAVLPDVALLPDFAAAAERVLSESRM
jgi:hypothetical protein